MPLYLHPSPPPAGPGNQLYQGFSAQVTSLLATSAWGWHAETGLHVLRMVLGGVFERHPGLRLVIGHGGEMLPFMLDRVDRQLTPGATGLPMSLSRYVLRHVWATTSGLFSLPPLLCALQVFGVDRVLFAVDYPYSPNGAGCAMLDALPLSPADRARSLPATPTHCLACGQGRLKLNGITHASRAPKPRQPKVCAMFGSAHFFGRCATSDRAARRGGLGAIVSRWLAIGGAGSWRGGSRGWSLYWR